MQVRRTLLPGQNGGNQLLQREREIKLEWLNTEQIGILYSIGLIN